MARIEAEVGTPKGGLLRWIDDRFPLSETMRYHITEYYASKNFNFWYVFGVLAMVVLVIQVVSGIFLTMNYKPSAAEAFASVEYIMRDVEMGWLIRYMHSTGASFFFIVVYLHMFRAMLYGSYKKPRELIWIIGMLIFFVLMAEGFAGYLLPWGQMSYWGAQVIISLFGAIPVIGDALVEYIRGDYSISDITLNRFFALHIIVLPLALIGLVFVHIVALHEVGSNNPDGVEIKEHKGPNGIPLDGVAFHPYHTSKDLVAIIIFLMFFSAVIFLLHAVLCGLARGAGQALGRYFDGWGRTAADVPAVAGSLESQFHSLPRLAVQGGADFVYSQLCRSGVARNAARRPRFRAGRKNFLGDLFRIFPADAVLHQHRQNQACPGEGGLPCLNSTRLPDSSLLRRASLPHKVLRSAPAKFNCKKRTSIPKILRHFSAAPAIS